MKLTGADDLIRRLRAVERSPRGVARDMAEDARDAARPMVPVKTGRGRASLKVVSRGDMEAGVTALAYVHILDVGARAHDIVPRRASVLVFPSAGGTIFARKVHKPQQRGLGFARKALDHAFRRNRPTEWMVDAWNKAA